MSNTTNVIKNSAITNGERLRTMTNEELAWVLQEFRFDAYHKAMGGDAALPDSQKEICDWLNRLA